MSCGAETLFPSELLFPSIGLAPGGGVVRVPVLPLNPANVDIDTTSTVFAALSHPVPLSLFYSRKFFNDLPEYIQGLPLRRKSTADPLPEYAADPDSHEATQWSIVKVILRAIAREQARVDYFLRGRVSLTDYLTNPNIPHATPPDDTNDFSLTYLTDTVTAPATFTAPASVEFADGFTGTIVNPASVTISGAAGTKYIFALYSAGQFTLTFQTTITPIDATYRLIGQVTWNGSSITAIQTYTGVTGTISDGRAFYDPYLDPNASQPTVPCAPLSQNSSVVAQFFAMTATWGLPLYEDMLGLTDITVENFIPFTERRTRVLRALYSGRAYTAADFTYLALAYATQLGIELGEFEEALDTDAGWDDPGYVIDGESTYPFRAWATVYSIEDLYTNPDSAARRMAELRRYINAMCPAHIQLGFDFTPIGGFLCEISLVDIDRV